MRKRTQIMWTVQLSRSKHSSATSTQTVNWKMMSLHHGTPVTIPYLTSVSSRVPTVPETAGCSVAGVWERAVWILLCLASLAQYHIVRAIHVPTWVSNVSLFITVQYSTVWLFLDLLDGFLGCFQILYWSLDTRLFVGHIPRSEVSG